MLPRDLLLPPMFPQQALLRSEERGDDLLQKRGAVHAASQGRHILGGNGSYHRPGFPRYRRRDSVSVALCVAGETM